MSMSDPTADMLTCIRNANRRGHSMVVVQHSKFKEGVVRVLKNEGYVKEFKVMPDEVLGEKKKTLHVYLKYGSDKERIITQIVRVSRPGRRIFRGVDKLGKVLDGFGISVLSTSKGILSDKQARKEKLGGEVICKVW